MKYLLLLFALFVSSVAHAERIYQLRDGFGCPSKDLKAGYYKKDAVKGALPPVGKSCTDTDGERSVVTFLGVYEQSFTIYYELFYPDGNKKGNFTYNGSISIYDECPVGTELNSAGQCEENRCKKLEGTSTQVGWYTAYFGMTPPSTTCLQSNKCIANSPLGLVLTPPHGKTTGSYDATATYYITAQECTPDPKGNPFCSDSDCSAPLTPQNPDPAPDPNPDPDPNPNPDPDPTPDPTPIPDDDKLPPGHGSGPSDPTDPIEQPTPSNPDATPDQPENPTESVGSAETAKAITNLNRDVNKSMAQINTKLAALTKSDAAINANIAKQLQQDYQIYQNLQKQMKANADYLGKRIDATGNSLYNQVGKMGADIVRQVNSSGDQISGKIDGLGDKVDGLGGKLDTLHGDLEGIADKICDPRKENCEGEHGLTGDGIKTMLGQLQGSLEGQADDADKGLMDELNKIAKNPVISQSEPDSMKGLLLNAIPSIGNCKPLVMSAAGQTMTIDCRFSQEFKMVFSWILYILTAYSLFNTVTEGITPNAVSGTKKRIH